MADSEIKVIINALLQDKDFKNAVKNMSTDMNKTSSEIKKNWANVVTGFNQGLELIKKGFFKIKEVISNALDVTVNYSKYKEGMEVLEKTTGESADKIISKLSKLSKGAISNMDLMLASNKAIALGVATNSDTIAQLLEVSRVKAIRMGIDTTQAFNDIVTGIGRGSPLILDNLGIITKGWDQEAKAKGASYDKQFILNKVLQQGSTEIKNLGSENSTTMEKVKSLSASFENLKLSIGPIVEKYVVPLVEWLGKLANAISEVIKKTNKYGVDLSENDEAMLRSGKNWQFKTEAVIEQNKKMYEATKRLENYNKRIKELENNMYGTGKATEDMVTMQEKLNYNHKQADALNKKIISGIKELGYESITTAEQFKKAYESTRDLILEQGKGSTLIIDNENKKVAEFKKINDDYYTYIGDLDSVKQAREQEDYETALESLAENLENKKISIEEYNLGIEEVKAIHEENLSLLEEEAVNYRLLLQQNAMEIYGQNYADLTIKQKGELLKMTQSQMKFYDDLKTGMKTAANSVVNDYSDGIAKMIVKGEIWHKSFGDFIKDLIEQVALLIVKLTIALGIKTALSGIGLGFLFSKGGVVPDLSGKKVVYAQSGFVSRGTDTVPAMLTPGERVLTVDQNRAFESLVRSFVPVGNTTTNNQNISFNGDFNLETMSAQDLIGQLMSIAENTNSRIFRR